MNHSVLGFGALVVGLLAAGPLLAQDHMHAPAAPAQVVRAVAVLHPTAGNQAAGTVTFTQEGSQVRVVAAVTGLKPNAKHGFHLHELGDCSAADATSAGPHFNPGGMPHAGPGEAMRHGGDFGNLTADAQGEARLDMLVDGISLQPGPTSIIGRGVIVHLQEDDLKTQPTGNAGARIACGTVGIAAAMK